MILQNNNYTIGDPRTSRKYLRWQKQNPEFNYQDYLDLEKKQGYADLRGIDGTDGDIIEPVNTIDATRPVDYSQGVIDPNTGGYKPTVRPTGYIPNTGQVDMTDYVAAKQNSTPVVTNPNAPWEEAMEYMKNNPSANGSNYEKEMDNAARRNTAIYGAEALMQLSTLLQGNYEIPPMPYATARAPQSISMVAPMMAARNEAMGTAYSIGSRMAEYGLGNQMPAVQANIASQRGTMDATIATTEGQRLNAQEEANTTAINTTEAARVAAEISRLQTQLQTNALVGAQKAQAVSNLGELMTRYANMNTGIAQAKEDAKLQRQAMILDQYKVG